MGRRKACRAAFLPSSALQKLHTREATGPAAQRLGGWVVDCTWSGCIALHSALYADAAAARGGTRGGRQAGRSSSSRRIRGSSRGGPPSAHHHPTAVRRCNRLQRCAERWEGGCGCLEMGAQQLRPREGRGQAGGWRLAEPQTQTSGGPIADCDEGVGGLSATNTMPPRVSGATGSMRAAAHHPPHLWAGLLHRMHRCMRASSGSGSSRQRERGSARRPGGGRLASPPLEGKQRRCAERWRNTPQRIQPPTLQQQQASRQECRNAGRSTRCCRPLECRRMLRGTAHWRGREQEVMPATATADGWW